METFHVLVDVTDIGNKKIGAKFWHIMEEREFADVHYVREAYMPDASMLYFIVEFDFRGERELNVFKLKHPEEHAILIESNEFYKNNQHRIQKGKRSVDFTL